MTPFRAFIAALLLSAAPFAALAQDVEEAPPPPDELGATAVETNPAVTYLMQTYGIDRQEAQMRIDLQDEIVGIAEEIGAASDSNFAFILVQHEPVYKIVIAYDDVSDKNAVLQAVDPQLRRFVQLRTVPKSRSGIQADLEALARAFEATGAAFGGGYNVHNGKYVFTVETNEAARELREAVPPALRGDVEIVVGTLPKPQAAPTGVQPGDWSLGGYWQYSSTSAGGACTWGYVVSFGSPAKRGLVTAAHCGTPRYQYTGGHWITFSGPVVSRQTGKYDYQVFDATGLNTDNLVYFEDKNSIPEFPASGYLNVTGTVPWSQQYAGLVMCKSGYTTGITCGTITNGNRYYQGSYGWIEVSKTKQTVISLGGDSGGPWFMYPGTSTNITAAGVHTAGDSVYGTSGIAIYMPIDYVNDHDSTVSVVTN